MNSNSQYSKRLYPKCSKALLLCTVLLFLFSTGQSQVGIEQIEAAIKLDPVNNALPVCIGGTAALVHAINLQYPPVPCTKPILKAYLHFDAEGHVTEAVVIRPESERTERNKKIEKYLELKSKWKPAIYHSEAVQTLYYVIALEDSTFVCPQEESEIESDYVPIISENETQDGEDTLFITSEPAEYPGGHSALISALTITVSLPQSCDIQSTVKTDRTYFRIVIDKEGNTQSLQIRSSALGCKELDGQACEVVKKLKQFKPAKHNGKIVYSYFDLAVKMHFKD